MLRQFGYVQTILKHPCESAPLQEILGDITPRFQRLLILL